MAHLEFQCQHCEQRLRMSDEHVGKTVRCPACKQTFVAALAASQGGANSATAKNSAPSTRSSNRDSAAAPRANRSKPPQTPAPQNLSGSQPAEPRSRATKKPVRRPKQEAAWEEAATWDDDINSWDDAESNSEDYADPYAATATPFVQAIERKFPQAVSRDLEGVAAADIDSILIGFRQNEASKSESPPSLLISPWRFATSQRSLRLRFQAALRLMLRKRSVNCSNSTHVPDTLSSTSILARRFQREFYVTMMLARHHSIRNSARVGCRESRH